MIVFQSMAKKAAKSFVDKLESIDNKEIWEENERQFKNHQWDIEQYDPNNSWGYLELREKVIDCYQKSVKKQWGFLSKPRFGDPKWYYVDVDLGLKLYSLLRINENISLADAYSLEKWIYIETKVFPDITFQRWKNGSKPINKDHFCDKWRIWLKSLWLYVYLSWQGDEETTRRVLLVHNGDDINKFLEVPCKGQRPEIYRVIMKKYYELGETRKKIAFSKLVSLHNATSFNIEPIYYPGGIEGYVDSLINEMLERTN